MTELTWTLRPARADEHGDLFALMMAESAGYIYDSLKTLGLDEAQFAALFKAVGDRFVIENGESRAGLCWIETREGTLHIHALIIEPSLQGQGVGSWAMKELIESFGDGATAVEVGVHESNARALALSHKLGFVQEEKRPDVGFLILRKHLS